MAKRPPKRDRRRPGALLIELDPEHRAWLETLVESRSRQIGEPTGLAATVRALIRYGVERQVFEPRS